MMKRGPPTSFLERGPEFYRKENNEKKEREDDLAKY